MTLKKIIKRKQEIQNRFTWNGVEVVIKDKIKNNNVSFRDTLRNIDEKIPSSFFSNVDIIYVGDFDFLKEREIQAMYENSCIFVTNEQSSSEDLGEDIVHEVAHSLEEQHKDSIYSDGKLEREFVEKRKQLYSVLRGEGIAADLHMFLDPSYNINFDEYLYKTVGYPLLNMVGASIFYSPYAITSLREYFANGFEALFYYQEYEFLNNSCHQLFAKLNNILEIIDD